MNYALFLQNQRVSAFASSERKLSEHHQPLKINEVNLELASSHFHFFSLSSQLKSLLQVKRKAQTLKDMRDYSFLLSDDADLPDNKELQPASRHVSAPKPGMLASLSFRYCL